MRQVTYRYQIGDILRLRRNSPLAAAGDYVLRSVGDTVCLSRLVQTARGRQLSRKRLYLLITDLCLFEETGRNYHSDSLKPVVAEVHVANPRLVLTGGR
jgi:hypothetical protein